MKDEILKLRNEGKSYQAIADALGIPFQRVEYYCSPTRRETLKRARVKYAAANRLQKKVSNFHDRSTQRVAAPFTYRDFLAKVGEQPVCYITKEPIDLTQTETYSIDHIVPNARGGTNELSNAGITLSKINAMKQDMTPQELFDACQKVLEANGYKVLKPLA